MTARHRQTHGASAKWSVRSPCFRAQKSVLRWRLPVLRSDHREVLPRGRGDLCNSLLPRMEEAASSGPSQMLGSHWVHCSPGMPSLRGRQAFVTRRSHSEGSVLTSLSRGWEGTAKAGVQQGGRDTDPLHDLPGDHGCAPPRKAYRSHQTRRCPLPRMAGAGPRCPCCPLCAVGPLLLPDGSGGHPARGQTSLCGDSDLWRPGVRWEGPSLRVLNQRLVRSGPWGRWSEADSH